MIDTTLSFLSPFTFLPSLSFPRLSVIPAKAGIKFCLSLVAPSLLGDPFTRQFAQQAVRYQGREMAGCEDKPALLNQYRFHMVCNDKKTFSSTPFERALTKVIL